jgi:hypothetical protein
MSRRWMCVLMLVCALVLVMPRAWAQWPPETHPTDQSRDIVMSWDCWRCRVMWSCGRRGRCWGSVTIWRSSMGRSMWFVGLLR